MKKRPKKALRQKLAYLERRIERLKANDPYRDVLTDYADAIQTALLEGGVAPFELGGLRLFDALQDLALSLAGCQKKGDHRLLRGLISLVNQRLPFKGEMAPIQRQFQWLVDLEHLLDRPQQPDQPPPTGRQIAEEVGRYLIDLVKQTIADGIPEDQKVAAHIETKFPNYWWGLFQCYNVEGLPRTNNELERSLRRIKMGQRRISGRKNVQDFIIRYGSYVAFVDYLESLKDLLRRLERVGQGDFLWKRPALDAIFLREQKRYRFRHKRTAYLKGVEDRWEAAVQKAML